MKHYQAPWSKALVVMSVIATLLCLAVAFGFPHLPARAPSALGFWFRWLLAAMVPGCALFTIRGYTIAPDAILVHRLLWSTRIPRAGLQSATFEPGIMCKSIRTCGNGGFFSFTGFYWNKSLKSFRAYVTDLQKTVVLRYEKRTVVLSPGDPEDFVRALTE